MLYSQRVRKIHPVDFESDFFGLSAELTVQGYHRIFFSYVEMMMMRVKRNSWSNDWCCNSCNFNFVSLPPAHAPIYFGEVKNARPFEGEISCNLWRMHVRMLLQDSSSKWNRSTCTRTAKHGCKQLIFAGCCYSLTFYNFVRLQRERVRLQDSFWQSTRTRPTHQLVLTRRFCHTNLI